MCLLPGDSQKEPRVHFYKKGGWKHSRKVKQILASLPASLTLLTAGQECRRRGRVWRESEAKMFRPSQLMLKRSNIFKNCIIIER